MPLQKVVCPHCGDETDVTIPSGKQMRKVEKRDGFVGSGEEYIQSTCINCGQSLKAVYH
jgi:hypothetical protein